MACDNAHEREWGDPMGELNDLLVAFTGTIDDFMYTYILVILLVATGVWFTIRTRFVQIRYIKDMFTNLVGKSVAADTEFSDDVANSVDTGKLPKAPGAANEHGSTAYADVSKPKRQRRISSFQALMVSTASRVGTGNIVGIATAIAIGGPGAVFWMWLMAIIGAASAFIESTLAQIWKVRNPDGTFRGGPAYYIQLALGKRWLGIVFAIALILCFGLGFNGLQTYNMASAIDYYVIEGHETVVNAIIGLFVVVAVAVVIFGGIHRISIITSWIVPIMAGAYILIAIWTCVSNLGDVPAALGLVFGQAFDFTSLAGGFTGSMIMWGIKRGLFSNEAGMGSAPNAAATADVSHPVKQGLVQSLSVYIDTLVICTCSALMMLIFCVQQPDTVAALVARQLQRHRFRADGNGEFDWPHWHSLHDRVHHSVRVLVPRGQLLLCRGQHTVHQGQQDRASGVPPVLPGRHLLWRGEQLQPRMESRRHLHGLHGDHQPRRHLAAGQVGAQGA